MTPRSHPLYRPRADSEPEPDLVDRQLEVMTAPSGAGEDAAYGQRAVLAAGDEVTLVLDADEVARIRVADLLP
jgi:hypothetical protein